MRKDLRTEKKTDGNKLNESQRKILILRSIKNRKKRLMATEGRLISLDNIQKLKPELNDTNSAFPLNIV